MMPVRYQYLVEEYRYMIISHENLPMTLDSRKIIGQLSAHLLDLEIARYLVSEHFTRFCRERNIDDIWKEDLDFSRDKPNLYGDDVVKNAFLHFLEHIYQSRKDEFLGILAVLIRESSGIRPEPAFFREINQDLIRLGYSMEDMKTIFSATGK